MLWLWTSVAKTRATTTWIEQGANDLRPIENAAKVIGIWTPKWSISPLGTAIDIKHTHMKDPASLYDFWCVYFWLFTRRFDLTHKYYLYYDFTKFNGRLRLIVCSFCTIAIIVVMLGYMITNIDGLMQDCSISIANAPEILQSCTKPST